MDKILKADLKEKLLLKRNELFFFLTGISFIMFLNPLRSLFQTSFESELYSHIIFIPIVSLYFIFSDRKKIFKKNSFSYNGIILLSISLLLFFIGNYQKTLLSKNDYLSILILSAVIWWIGSFILIYGYSAYLNASFPLLFLVFMIPVPVIIIDNIILTLQVFSADVSYFFFTVLGIPVFREGFIFELPGLNIEVAKQCSGIRSSLILVITSILLGHLYLKAEWKKIILLGSIFPITVFKNGVRIVTLSALAIYVDKSVLTDPIIHGRSGYPFFILALLEVYAVLWFLRRREKLE